MRRNKPVALNHGDAARCIVCFLQAGKSMMSAFCGNPMDFPFFAEVLAAAVPVPFACVCNWTTYSPRAQHNWIASDEYI
jgi:hypothetical protein